MYENENENISAYFTLSQMKENIHNLEHEPNMFSDPASQIEYIYFAGNDAGTTTHPVIFQFLHKEQREAASARAAAFVVMGQTYLLTLNMIHVTNETLKERIAQQGGDAENVNPDGFLFSLLKMCIRKSFFYDFFERKFYIVGTRDEVTDANISEIITAKPAKSFLDSAKEYAISQGFNPENPA